MDLFFSILLSMICLFEFDFCVVVQIIC